MWASERRAWATVWASTGPATCTSRLDVTLMGGVTLIPGIGGWASRRPRPASEAVSAMASRGPPAPAKAGPSSNPLPLVMNGGVVGRVSWNSPETPVITVSGRPSGSVETSMIPSDPRTAATALGVRISTSSPGRISRRATITRIFPSARLISARWDPSGRTSSRISKRESSRTVTVILPIRRIRARDSFWVSTTSRTKRLSRSLSGVSGAWGRLRSARPVRAVTTPMPFPSWAQAGETKGSRRATARRPRRSKVPMEGNLLGASVPRGPVRTRPRSVVTSNYTRNGRGGKGRISLGLTPLVSSPMETSVLPADGERHHVPVEVEEREGGPVPLLEELQGGVEPVGEIARQGGGEGVVHLAPHHLEHRPLHAGPLPRRLVQGRREGVLLGVVAELEIVTRLKPDLPRAGHLKPHGGLLAEVAVVRPDGIVRVELVADAEEVLPAGEDQDVGGAEQVVLAVPALLAEIQGVGRAKILILVAVLEEGEVGVILEEREGGGPRVGGEGEGG